MYVIKKVDTSANTVTVQPSGSDKIDGASTYVISQQFLTVSIQSDGSAWFILEVSNTDVNGEMTARMEADSTLQNSINAVTINSYGVTTNAAILANDEVFADTTSGIITLTLPASPATGNRVRVLDPNGSWGTNKCVIARNGNKIAGFSSDLELTVSGDSVELVQCDIRLAVAMKSSNTENNTKMTVTSERRKALIHRWREANKEKIAEKRHQYYFANKKHEADTARQWKENNKERLKKYDRTYQASNREKRRAYRRTPEVREQVNAARRQRYANDLQYRMRCLLRAAFKQAIRLYGEGYKYISLQNA